MIMQAFKIEHYEREHGRGTFVPFRHLTNAETNLLQETLKKHLKFPREMLPGDMVQAIYDRSVLVEGANADGEEFDLQELLRRLQFPLSEVTYMNWYRYDDVDEIQTKDILTVFSEIRYPSVDDLDLIDSNMQWILLIHHSGTVRALRLENS